MKSRSSLWFEASVFTVILLVSLISSARAAEKVELLNASYDVSRELHAEK